jgi:hypothetical protein
MSNETAPTPGPSPKRGGGEPVLVPAAPGAPWAQFSTGFQPGAARKFEYYKPDLGCRPGT